MRAEIHAELARLHIDVDPAEALKHATLAVAAAPSPVAMRERLVDTPAIAARQAADPAWRRLLSP